MESTMDYDKIERVLALCHEFIHTRMDGYTFDDRLKEFEPDVTTRDIIRMLVLDQLRTQWID